MTMKIRSLVTGRGIEYVVTEKPPANDERAFWTVQNQLPCKAIISHIEGGQRSFVVHMHSGDVRRVYDAVETVHERVPEPPEFQPYVGADGKEHAEF